MVLKINGDIVSNDMKEAYEWFGFECTSPGDVADALQSLPQGDRLEIKINSGGGDVMAGQEIYSELRNRNDVDIEVESMAASAASLIAMAGHSSISPVGLLMIHDVSVVGASGNKRDMKKMSEILSDYDTALATAYAEKTGKDVDEIIKLMDKETYLPASKAIELGFIDEMSKAATTSATVTNAIGHMMVTDEMIAEYNEAMKAEAERKMELENIKQELIKDLDMFGV